MDIYLWQIELKIFLLKDIHFKDVMTKVATFIDNTLKKNEKWNDYDKERKCKGYSFNSLYPIMRNGIYKKGRVYTVQIRTVVEELKDYLMEELKQNTTEEMKGLLTEVKHLKTRKTMDKLVSVTPLVIKGKKTYWRKDKTIENFVDEIRMVLIEQYNELCNEEIDKNTQIFTGVRFRNRYPIKTRFKNKYVLGEKVELDVAENETAQRLAFLSLGVGAGHMADEGFSFVNPIWK